MTFYDIDREAWDAFGLTLERAAALSRALEAGEYVLIPRPGEDTPAIVAVYDATRKVLHVAVAVDPARYGLDTHCYRVTRQPRHWSMELGSWAGNTRTALQAVFHGWLRSCTDYEARYAHAFAD